MTFTLQNCASVVPLLDGYHDGELAVEERTAVEQHLRGCDSCSRRLASVGKLVSALKTLPPMAPRIDFADQFEQVISQQDAKKPAQNVVVLKKFGWAAAVAASVILSLGIGQYVLNHNGGGSEIASTTRSISQPVGSNQVSKTLQAEELATSTIDKRTPANVPSQGHPAVSGPKTNIKTEVASQPAHVSLSEHKLASLSSNTIENSKGLEKDSVAATRNHSQVASEQLAAQVPAEGVAPAHSLVAYYEPETNSVPEELGISTDEDGLYAIKM